MTRENKTVQRPRPMQSLPPEIALRVLNDLPASDLASRCQSDRQSASLCTDSYFWRQKVRSVSRRALQTDWIIPLAEMGEERLLGYLLDAAENEGIVIDQWVLLVALLNLDREEKRSRLVNRLYGMVKKELRLTLTDDADDLYKFKNKLDLEIDAIKNNWKKKGTLSRITPTNHIDSYYIARRLASLYKKLPTPSFFLGQIVVLSTYDARELYDVIIFNLLPYHAREGNLEPLQQYKNDVAAMNRSNKVVYELGRKIDAYNWERVLSSWEDSIVGHGSYELYNALIENVYEFDGIEIADRDVFRRVTALSTVPHEYFNGYVALEPEEWLDWLKTLRNATDAEIRDLIRSSYELARDEGYSYFAQTIEEQYGRDFLSRV